MNKETLEEAAEKYVEDSSHELYELRKESFIDGAKWQSERMYSEGEVLTLFDIYKVNFNLHRNVQVLNSEFNTWFEQFKKK